MAGMCAGSGPAQEAAPEGARFGRGRRRQVGLEQAGHQYFRQSEQIPSRIRLGVGSVLTGAGLAWRAGGLIVQFMPNSPERMRAADLHPGDAPEGHEILAAGDDDGVSDDAWTEARSLVETVEHQELFPADHGRAFPQHIGKPFLALVRRRKVHVPSLGFQDVHLIVAVDVDDRRAYAFLDHDHPVAAGPVEAWQRRAPQWLDDPRARSRRPGTGGNVVEDHRLGAKDGFEPAAADRPS